MHSSTTLIGRLGQDPEVRVLEGGNKVAKLNIATTENWKSKQSGEWQEHTTWHNVIVWKGGADYAEKHLRKGTLVMVEGTISNRTYEDKEGVKRRVSEIKSNTLKKLDKYDKVDSSIDFNEPIAPATNLDPNHMPKGDADDVPF